MGGKSLGEGKHLSDVRTEDKGKTQTKNPEAPATGTVKTSISRSLSYEEESLQ
jgi:hypothetical protein